MYTRLSIWRPLQRHWAPLRPFCVKIDEVTKTTKLKEYKRQYYLENKEKARQYRLDNLERIKEVKREYYLNNKERLRGHKEQYRFENRGRINESMRIYRQNNKEKARQYRLNNKERISQMEREYRLKNREKVREAQRRYYREKNSLQIEPKQRNLLSWKTNEDLRRNLLVLGEILEIKYDSDWYRVSSGEVARLGYSGYRGKYKNFGFALQAAFPEKEWDMERFKNRDKRSAQRWLKLKLSGLLPEGTEIEEDYSYDSQNAGKFQLDLFVAEFNLALEYQGEQHYVDIRGFGQLEEIMRRDQRKKEICRDEGITLLQIPYWWNKQQESLLGSLSLANPEVFKNPHNFEPIPDEPTKKYFNGIFSEERNSEIAKKLMHGRDWNFKAMRTIDPTGWVLSEKFDGIRGYWDGEELWTRNGSLLNIPEKVRELLPPGIPLDGELWLGYDCFYQLLDILRESQKNSEGFEKLWERVQFLVFDAPEHSGDYLHRNQYLKDLIPSSSRISVIEAEVCRGAEHLGNKLNEVKMRKGEGLMLYRPHQPYTLGRSSQVLKLKQLELSKVTFKKINPKSYSFLCQQENGQSLIVKCSTDVYENPPPEGTVLRVQHDGFLKSGKLKYPTFRGVDHDLVTE